MDIIPIFQGRVHILTFPRHLHRLLSYYYFICPHIPLALLTLIIAFYQSQPCVSGCVSVSCWVNEPQKGSVLCPHSTCHGFSIFSWQVFWCLVHDKITVTIWKTKLSLKSSTSWWNVRELLERMFCCPWFWFCHSFSSFSPAQLQIFSNIQNILKNCWVITNITTTLISIIYVLLYVYICKYLCSLICLSVHPSLSQYKLFLPLCLSHTTNVSETLDSGIRSGIHSWI